jgi:hypothetical protein
MTLVRSLVAPLAAMALAAAATPAHAQAGPAPTAPAATAAPATPAAPATSPGTSPAAVVIAPPSGPLAEFAWLTGCWRGTVNQREFREHWMPLRGNLLIGTGHTVTGDRTQDFEYIRLEPRGDAVHYVALPYGQKEASFKLAERTSDGPDTIWTFANPEHDFPQRIVYRRATEGWLYIHVEGKVKGEDRRIIYPLRRIDCEGGELIPK